MITRTLFDNATAESCASLANRCLTAGGMYNSLQSKASSQTSSVAAPDVLLRQVIAVKNKELSEAPDSKNFRCLACDNESDIKDIEAAYRRINRSADANNDKFPLAETKEEEACRMM